MNGMYVNRQFANPLSIQHYSTSPLPTEWGEFIVHVYRDANHQEHMAICKGTFAAGQATLTRVHSACFTGEALGSLKCDCKAQLEFALQKIQQAESGVVVYLFQEGRGIGLGDKIKAYALQETQGLDTVDANTHLGLSEDARTYENAYAILQDLGIDTIKLMTNNPLKVQALQDAGIHVQERIAVEVGLNQVNYQYLETKQQRMGHWLTTQTQAQTIGLNPSTNIPSNDKHS